MKLPKPVVLAGAIATATPEADVLKSLKEQLLALAAQDI